MKSAISERMSLQLSKFFNRKSGGASVAGVSGSIVSAKADGALTKSNANTASEDFLDIKKDYRHMVGRFDLLSSERCEDDVNLLFPEYLADK